MTVLIGLVVVLQIVTLWFVVRGRSAEIAPIVENRSLTPDAEQETEQFQNLERDTILG